MEYIVYRKADGKILRTGSCPHNMLEAQAKDGELVREGKASDLDQKINESGDIVTCSNSAHKNDELIRSFINAKICMLSASNWTQLPDSPLSESKKLEWATYRQALRDLPQLHSKAESLDDIIWPIQPE